MSKEMKNPKAKGSGYEREVGEKISLWLSHGEHKHLLCRTVGSGAQFTTSAKKMIQAGQAGDLMAQDEKAFAFFEKVIIEAKFWKDLQLIRFLAEEGELYAALLKVKRESEQVGKKWFLICRQNRRNDLLFIPAEAFNSYWYSRIKWHSLFSGTVYMFLLKDFLGVVEPEIFINQQRELLPQRA